MVSDSQTAEHVVDEVWQQVVAECARLKQRRAGILGCRLFYSPKGTLESNTGLLIAGINPGRELDMADRLYPTKPHNAYLWELWTGSNQYRDRVQDIVQRLASEMGIQDWRLFFDRCVTANFIPFRSADASAISNAECKRFATSMWGRLLPIVRPRAALIFGRTAYDGFKGVFERNAKLGSAPLVGLQHSRGGYESGDDIRRYAHLFRSAGVTP